jgi:anti-sigma regulatory factor (Ser/Thr protein kinase)
VPAGDAKDILLAVWEAATNAVEHGSRDGGTVTVSASIVGDRVLIEVVDDGRWQEPRQRENRGLGLPVIRSLMTDVELAHSDRGTQVRMERSLSSQAAGNRGRGEGED